MPQLERLDLSYNRLQFLDAATLASLPSLLVLKVNFSLLVLLRLNFTLKGEI